MVRALQHNHMMRIVPVLASVALAGCIGDVPSGSGSGSNNGSNTVPDAGLTDTAKSLLMHWSGCMTLANFQTAGMAAAWGTLLTLDNKQCQGCHNLGAYGFIATEDEAKFFEAITLHSSYMSMYFTADVPAGTVIVNTVSFKAANSSLDHPKFDPVNNTGMMALNAFHATTAAITTCDPPKMID